MLKKTPQKRPIDPAERYVAVSAMQHRSGLVVYRVTHYTTSPRQLTTELIGEDQSSTSDRRVALRNLLTVAEAWLAQAELDAGVQGLAGPEQMQLPF